MGRLAALVGAALPADGAAGARADGVNGEGGDAAAERAALRAVELWGFPTSAPARDPRNRNFMYQRFQRGVLHHDRATGTTRGLLLADNLKALLTGERLPSDLAEQARGTPIYGQYCPTLPRWVCRPAGLPASDLALAFEPQ